MITGAVPGIAFRMNNFDLKSFSLDEGTLYPQVKASLLIAKNYDAAIINKCGVVTPDWGNSVPEMFKEQNRPMDFGLNERIIYLKKYAGTKVTFHFIRGTIVWYINNLTFYKEKSYFSLYEIIYSISIYYFNLFTLFYIIQKKEFKILVCFFLILMTRPFHIISFINSSFILLSKGLKSIMNRRIFQTKSNVLFNRS